MRISFTKIVTLLSLFIAIFVSICPPIFASPRRVEECGVERYVVKADPSCGVQSYLPARDPICGVDMYREGASMSCPGSIPSDEYTYGSPSSVGPNIGSSCPREGYNVTGTERASLGDINNNYIFHVPRILAVLTKGGLNLIKQPGPGGGIAWTTVTCTRPSQPAICRMPQFGVELYKECRDPKFGVESYGTCERPEFGVGTYKECEIRKTRAELTIYLQNLDQNVDVMGVALLQSEANLLKSEGSEIGLACFIKRWEPDPLYIDLVTELKTQFIALFGENYDSNNYDCSNQVQVNIPTKVCDSNDGTSRCKALRAYKAAREYLEINETEVAALIDDVVVRSDAGFKQQLESLDLRVQKYLQ